MIGQIQNLKKVVSGAGISERRISNKIQRDSWSALKYALRLAQKLEQRYLSVAQRKTDWDKAFEEFEHAGSRAAAKPRTVGRKGGRLFA